MFLDEYPNIAWEWSDILVCSKDLEWIRALNAGQTELPVIMILVPEIANTCSVHS